MFTVMTLNYQRKLNSIQEKRHITHFIKLCIVSKYAILSTYLTVSSQHSTKMTVKGRGSSYKPVKAKVVIIIKNWKVESVLLL